jgi:acyl carrier protein
MSSTHEHLGTLLTRDFGVPQSAVVPDVTLEDLRLDSLALEELRFLAEERFDIDLTDAAMTPRSTVRELTTLIEDHIRHHHDSPIEDHLTGQVTVV